MIVQELIERLQQIEDKDQEIFVSIDKNDGLDVMSVEEDPCAVFINVHDDNLNWPLFG